MPASLETCTMAAVPEIREFLLCETPDAWIAAALANQDVLLIDHANCEKKAAATAMNLLYRYIDRPALLHKLSRLAREELRHFEQVLALMQKRGIEYVHVSPSRYASSLREGVRSHEPAKLVDTLICGALIEARSCERFARLAPHLDAELGSFYQSLLKSEARHFQDYLKLAQQYANEPLDQRIVFFAAKERELIESGDTEFRFHSGVYTAAAA
jgi:tRNA-(ms[2]io[6]A)-hydroxylase